MDRRPANDSFLVVSFKKPVLWTRNIGDKNEEVWMLQPRRRYVMCAHQLGSLTSYIDKISDLESATLYKPLRAAGGNFNAGCSILVERTRERGVGDLLFMTGPLAYLRHLTAGACKVDMYAMADRGSILGNNPILEHKSPLTGPLVYEDLAHYDFHWFVSTVSEYCEERDQENVYDILYKSMGLNPAHVPAVYKRPSVVLDDSDMRNTDQFLKYVWMERKLDLRQTGYYIILPYSRSVIRSMPYGTWLGVIAKLATKRPVLVAGDLTDRAPVTDMSFGEFAARLGQLGPNVVDVIGRTPTRVLLGLMSKATAVGCLDSGGLYMAQALRTPAVSVWGNADPRVRVGYDKEYMDLAVWQKDACGHAPCYSYSGWPSHKCPMGEGQRICNPLAAATPDSILEKFNKIEERNVCAS